MRKAEQLRIRNAGGKSVVSAILLSISYSMHIRCIHFCRTFPWCLIHANARQSRLHQRILQLCWQSQSDNNSVLFQHKLCHLSVNHNSTNNKFHSSFKQHNLIGIGEIHGSSKTQLPKEENDRTTKEGRM